MASPHSECQGGRGFTFEEPQSTNWSPVARSVWEVSGGGDWPLHQGLTTVTWKPEQWKSITGLCSLCTLNFLPFKLHPCDINGDKLYWSPSDLWGCWETLRGQLTCPRSQRVTTYRSRARIPGLLDCDSPSHHNVPENSLPVDPSPSFYFFYLNTFLSLKILGRDS